MTKTFNWLYRYLAMHSDVGIGLLLVNIIGMLWFCLVTGKKLPEQTSTIVLGIFAAKTSHGIFTAPGGSNAKSK